MTKNHCENCGPDGEKCICPCHQNPKEEKTEEPSQELDYREVEKMLNDFKNKRINYSEAIEVVSGLLKSEREHILGEIDKMRKNERNMAKGEYVLETVGEVEAWNYALEDVKKLITV